jgi:hypothetical protein
MKYKPEFSQRFDLSAPSVTGYGDPLPTPFYAWQPSTWPDAPTSVDDAFIKRLKQIFGESILGEINNVIEDAKKCAGSLEHRGHVVAIGLLCALDAISSYGYGARSGEQISPFVAEHFPADYRAHGDALRKLYRNSMVHSWNLFEVSLYPGTEKVTTAGGALSLGVLDLFEALVQGTEDFLDKLSADTVLQRNTLARYSSLRRSAKP